MSFDRYMAVASPSALGLVGQVGAQRKSQVSCSHGSAFTLLFEVPIGEHALMQDARNQYAFTLLAIKYNVLAVFQTAQARSNVITRSA